MQTFRVLSQEKITPPSFLRCLFTSSSARKRVNSVDSTQPGLCECLWHIYRVASEEGVTNQQSSVVSLDERFAKIFVKRLSGMVHCILPKETAYSSVRPRGKTNAELILETNWMGLNLFLLRWLSLTTIYRRDSAVGQVICTHVHILRIMKFRQRKRWSKTNLTYL
ncbi:hypothetical protein TNCV_5084751 [Trichonephila clavipes]|uniref:Uncharacterized protein n=1 Tax=Trichonephila clavipes TaxID=2585209 RepID=A0A8X6S9H7_TRICX|nr:hypothetical protein TNCV_5084751 [Trichonephila clavipes]